MADYDNPPPGRKPAGWMPAGGPGAVADAVAGLHRDALATRFQVGDRVEKWTGDYQAVGEVRAVFTTRAGKVRYVVEHTPGFLHIYGPANLRPADNNGRDGTR